jgi:hypothetical protein
MTASKQNEAASRLRAPAKRKRLCLLSVILLPLLVGCHADVTVRFDIRGDGAALVTTKEIIDDELYKLALSQDASGDPFHLDTMRHAGWLVLSDIDGNRSHVFTISKLINRNERKGLNRATPILGDMSRPLGIIEVSRAPGLFFERDSLSATIAPLLPLVSSTFGRFYVGVASGLLNSVLTVHLEMKTPGKILATNGTILPDGAVRWDLNLEEPTTIDYSARVINFNHLALAILIALVLGLAISAAQGRSSARTLFRWGKAPIRKG